MKKDQKIAQAEANLQRKLEWIGRHDNKVIIMTGIVIAMLGVLSSSCALVICWSPFEYILFSIAFVLLLSSLVLMYYSQYPKITSPNSSLIFFKTIAELDYQDFKNQTDSRKRGEYFDDLLFQIHINSQILSKKFYNLKLAMILLGMSVIPWLAAVYMSKIYFK